MKKVALLFVGLSLTLGSFAQETEVEDVKEVKEDHGSLKKVPSMELKDMDGNAVNTADLGFDGPVVISFWATWCSPCKLELNTIHDDYTDWQEEFGVNLVAVAIDDQKTVNSVPMYVNGKSWEYLILMDTNWDFKRAMGVNNVPHTFLLDSQGNIVYSHNNFSPGDEIALYDEIAALVKREKEAAANQIK